MVPRHMRMIAVAVGLAVVALPDHVMPQELAGDARAFQGLWSGTWGGGRHDGVVFQPVIADLLIEGDHVELAGFPDVGRLTGTVHFDAGPKRMRIIPAAAAGGQPTPKSIEYAYEITGDELRLTAGDKPSISFQKLRVVQNPLADARVELVAARGINDAGDLLVTKLSVLRAGRTGTTYFRPEEQSLSTRQAIVLLVQEAGLKKVSVEQARRLIRESTPVMVTYRQDERPSRPQRYELWKDMGSPAPDSEAVGLTFSRILRPGTLVFVLSAHASVPVP